MSWTVRILIVFWLCFISVSEADLGASCNVNDTSSCTETIESCIGDSCECSSGHFNVSNVCKSSSIIVTLTTQPGSVVYGSTVTLTATITSEVPLNPIKWLKGSTELVIASPKYTQSDDGPGTVTLTINNVDFTDSGNYKVEVSNIAGTTSTSIQVSLTVTGEEPTVTLPGTITETDTTVTIDCTVIVAQGSPTVTVYWLYNGQNLDTSNSAKYSGGTVSTPSLTIKNIASTDAGEYHCGARNLLGSSTSSKSVTLEKPTVTLPGTTTETDTTVTIDCTVIVAQGSPIVTVYWLYNGQNLDTSNSAKYSGGTVSTPALTIKNIASTDAGVYHCGARNLLGSSTSSKSVTLEEPTVTLPGTITETDTTVTIDCTVIVAQGSPTVTVYWLYNGQNLDTSNSAKFSGGIVSTPSLTIKNIASTDAGVYHCGARNLLGSSTSSKSVTLEKPTVTVPGTITETDTIVTIHCTASVSQGSPALTSVYWLLNGQNLEISNSAKFSGGTVSNPSLSIHNLASADAGEYHCGARNLLGSSTSSKSVTLAVPSVVTISKQPAGPVNYNSSVTFNGSYTSNLLSVSLIKWQKLTGATFINIDITGDKYTGSSVTGTSPQLKINPVQFIDKTSYRLEVSNRVGSTSSSIILLNVIGGNLTVTTGDRVTGRFGGSVTIDCNVTGPEVSNIQWIKYINNAPVNILIDGNKFSGGNLSTKALTINSLTNDDARQYQCTASNPGGTYSSANRATVQVNYGQFNEACNNSEPCDSSEFLTCYLNSKCLCVSTYYHKNQVCYPKTRIAPTNIFLNSTSNMFFVSWNNPTADFELVSGYEVTWRFSGSSSYSSGPLEKNVNQYTVSSGLMAGQLYTVAVISKVTLTNPTESTVVASSDFTMRTVPSSPGPVIPSESNFAHNNLQIKWTAPVNTVVTKYEVTLDGTTYTTMGSEAMYQFSGKDFVPGKSYVLSIVTVSGTTSDIVKKSSEHTESIRTTPTKPNPPTNLQCPQSPLDISLEISWTAPAEPNGLIYRYQINVSLGNLSQIFTTSNETSKNVENLSPEQMYTFTVRTINDALDNTSEPSEPLNCTTKAGVSTAPRNLNIDEVQSRGFKIQFNRPDDVKGILAAYKIFISEGGNCVQQILVQGHCSTCMNTDGCPPPIYYNFPDITNNVVSYIASGLDPYTHYMVKVVAINGKGEGHPVNTTITTDEEVPQQPEQINASNVQSSSLTLAWTLLDPSPGNTTYTIYTYEGTDDNGTSFLKNKSTKVYGFDTKTLSVTGLEEYWPYKFKVTAATVKGDNTSDFSSVFRTKQAAPGQVLNLSVQKRESDYKSAYVSWSPPALKHRNGVLKSYLFSVNHNGTVEEEEIPVLLAQDTVEKKIPVIPDAVYIIEVVLQNNESMKSQPSMQSYEAPAGPPPVTNIKPITTTQEEHKPTTNTIPLNINTTYFNIDENGKQVFGGIAVCAESKCKDMGKTTIWSVWESLPNWHKAKKEEFPLYRATNDTFLDMARTGNSRKKRSTSAPTLPFIIGEDITCSSLNEDVYCNGPLNQGTSYFVIIFACTSGGCTYYKTDEPFITAKIEEPQDFPIGLIAGVVVAVVVVAVIVGVAFVVVRRRNRLGETKQYTKGIDNPTSLDEPVPKNIPRKRPIKLKELSDKVAEKHKDSNLHFAREYEDLKALSPKHPAETSELDNNKLKNRYVNILPFDHSRVKLMLTEDDDPSTDFINANYLPGYKSQREYIATQGPIPGTIDDFWRMIWEQNVSIIVMLTLCKEEGRVKCEMYWPENIHEPKQYGDLVVETVSNSTVNFYEFRIFKIKLGDTTRSVKHFHFLQWKDFSANVQNDVMIDFIKNVRNHIRPPDMNGPVVVHCSAGVGRTGTYCALDHLFQFVDEHDLDESIDIFDLVMNLRERRMFMVQTEQQYVFIHDCVRDYVERKKKELQGNLLYENVNRGFVADDEPVEESLYQNYSNQRTDL